MSKNKLHLVVDVLAYLAMAGLAATGVIMYCRLPPGSGSDSLLGRTRHEWGSIHFGIALSLIALVALHVVLHWKWVTNTFGALLAGRGPKKRGAGPAGALVIAALGLAAAALVAAPWMVRVSQGTRGGHRGGRHTCDECPEPCPTTGTSAAVPEEPRGKGRHGQQITGQTTLAEAARMAGVPVERLIAELKLPDFTPEDSRLGHLRQDHGFSIQDVRAVVARLKEASKPE